MPWKVLNGEKKKTGRETSFVPAVAYANAAMIVC